MIDTVRLKVLGAWKRDTAPGGWIVSNSTKKEITGNRTFERRCWQQEDTGFRVSGSSEDATAIECSLPRLLHGSNGALLKSEEEVTAALRLVKERASKVIEFSPYIEPALTRLDAAWNCEIDGGVRTVIRAVENTRHEDVRRATVVYQGESIHYPGKNCRIRIYDKGKELKGKESNVVRFEAQFRGKFVAQFNDDGRNMGTRAYGALREAICKLQPIDEPRFSRLADLFAHMEQDGVRDSQGRDILGIYLAGMTRSSRYRLQAQMKRARVARAKIVLAELFPLHELPPVVEIAA